MCNSKNQNIFSNFLAEWHTQFQQIPFILSYIKSYPQLVSKLKGYNLLDEEEVESSQKEWLLLMEKFDHPLEKEFFKPWYVPVLKDSYDLFIDLSAPGFTLFEPDYFPFAPYAWLKKIWFENISDFLTSANDESIDVTAILMENEKRWKEENDVLFLKHIELGIAGKIDPPEISSQEIFLPDIEPEVILNQKSLTITGVKPLVLQLLLPNNYQIRLIELFTWEDLTEDLNDKITDIKGLVFYLHSIGRECVSFCEFLFIPSDVGFMKYENNVFILSHNDFRLLNDLQIRFLSFKQKIRM